MTDTQPGLESAVRRSRLYRYGRDFRRNKYIYLMLLPVLGFFVIFHYMPMYGAVISFKDFRPGLGIWGSPWVGFSHFTAFFRSFYFFRLVRNTILLNVYDIVWGFPAPIIFALLLNEVRNPPFKRSVQTLSYLPYFLSMVVVCGLIVDFTSRAGFVNDIVEFFGGTRRNWLGQEAWFRTIYVSTNIWQNLGWGSIIYLAAISTIDPQLYESAVIEGAGRWKQTRYITIPCIVPTITILLVLRIGALMSVGFEKILLLYSPLVYETADVIATFVYRKGILENDYSYSAAIGLFNSIIGFTLIVTANWFSKRVSETSLW